MSKLQRVGLVEERRPPRRCHHCATMRLRCTRRHIASCGSWHTRTPRREDRVALAVPAGNSDVQLSLPKFSFTSPTFSLKAALKAMGMPIAFEQGAANFQGLTADPAAAQGIYIAGVLQKTMIGVQETGVEAAAATAVILDGSNGSTSGMSSPPVPMNVNRPFLISIVDQPTGAVLFLGHVEDPTPGGS